MQSVRALTGIDVGPIRAFLAKCDEPFKISELYATADSTRFADTDVRLSQSRAIIDPSLSALCEKLAGSISTDDEQYDYTLCPDNITHVKYDRGGFFKRHRDHCRGTSNIIEEFTLIVNVNPEGVPCKGGRTIIHAATSGTATVPTTFVRQLVSILDPFGKRLLA